MLNAVIAKATSSSNLNLDAVDDEKVSDDKDEENAKAPSYASIDEADKWLRQRNMFNSGQANNDEDEEQEEEDFLQFQVQDTAGMEKDQLVDYCDELESKLIEEKTLRYGLQKSQQVIIDHLM